MSGDNKLTAINGIKPKKYLADGDECEVRSFTSDIIYNIKRTQDHYHCTCPSWRNQARVTLTSRTCKHLRTVLGDAYEDARTKVSSPGVHVPTSPTSAGKGGDTRTKKTATKRDHSNISNCDNQKSSSVSRKRRRSGSEVSNLIDEGHEVMSKGNISLLLAVKWHFERGVDPTGWWVSEKLDGVRVFWDGKRMLSRLGNPFHPPKWFIEKLPSGVTLDGELFGGRGRFQSTVSIVKTSKSPHWNEITFKVFDVPSMGHEAFEKRLEWMKSTFMKMSGGSREKHVDVVDHIRAKNREHVLQMLRDVEALGGEGLMLRKPKSLYVGCRSSTLQKIKTFHDAEAKVVGYISGKGKNTGIMGALKCEMASGKTFSVGSGFSDKQRKRPPKIGSIITYRFQELTLDGIPRFPTYAGEAFDKDKPEDAGVL